MSIRETAWHDRLEAVQATPSDYETLAAVGVEALRTVDLCYGGLGFHQGGHSMFVGDKGGLVSERRGVSPYGQQLARAAGRAHDLVQLQPRGIMEDESAAWLEEQLRRQGAPGAAAVAGGLAIRGTEPLFDENGKIVGQMAARQEYPSREAESIALSVASADMGGELFRPLGPLRGHQFLLELNGIHAGSPRDERPTLEQILAFQQSQIELKTGYVFPCAEGETALGGLRRAVIDYHQELAEDIGGGRVESWQQVIDRDLAFARQHGEAWPADVMLLV